MKNFVLAPDSFKGTMSSREVCAIMESSLRSRFPGAHIVSVPVADGGEGSVDCFLSAAGGTRRTVAARGPYGEELDAFYGVLPDGTAVVEAAACAGLPLAGNRLRPDLATTYGVGQLIAHAARSGCRKILLALGGSCTNDAGAGAAAAAGVRFLDGDGRPFVPAGGTLARVEHIDLSGLDPAVRNAEITVLCDIDNPFCGENGAAFVFAPQKGADDAMVRRLDAGLAHLAGVLRRELGADVEQLPGAGAAGGMGGGMAVFFGAGLRRGIEVVLDAVGFEKLARNADLVFTGEGRLDAQSLRGKVVAGVARRAKALGVPAVAVVGDIGEGVEVLYEEGLAGIFSINRTAVEFARARTRCREDLALTMDNLARFLTALRFE